MSCSLSAQGLDAHGRVWGQRACLQRLILQHAFSVQIGVSWADGPGGGPGGARAGSWGGGRARGPERIYIYIYVYTCVYIYIYMYRYTEKV